MTETYEKHGYIGGICKDHGTAVKLAHWHAGGRFGEMVRGRHRVRRVEVTPLAAQFLGQPYGWKYERIEAAE